VEEAIDRIFFRLGTGQAQIADNSEQEALILRLLEDCALKPLKSVELLSGCLAKAYAEKTGEPDSIEKFLALEEAANEEDKRTRLQDRLLGVYAESCGIEAEGFDYT
jgi:hypothetical protein